MRVWKDALLSVAAMCSMAVVCANMGCSSDDSPNATSATGGTGGAAGADGSAGAGGTAGGGGTAGAGTGGSAGNEADGAAEADAPSAACNVTEPIRSAKQGSDLGCVGAVNWGKTTCTKLTLSGTVHSVMGGPIPATVEVFDGKGVSLGKVTTPDGNYSVDIAVGEGGYNGRMLATSDGYLPHDYFDLARPYLGNLDGSLALVTPAMVSQIMTSAQAGTQDPAKGLVIVRAQDCKGDSLAGVTVEIDRQYGKRLYSAANGLPDVSLQVTSSFGGVLFTNVETGVLTATVYQPGADGGAGTAICSGTGTSAAGVFTGLSADPK